jgi:cupin superfamily acireductone dioxygenase involved in methionine salvage
MTTLTIYKDDKWFETVFDPFIIEQLVKNELKVKLHQEASVDIKRIEQIKTKKGFASYDIFTSTNLINHITHYHNGDECRIFLEGTGTFYIDKDNVSYELTVGPGDRITIPSGVRHGFKTTGKIVAVRFFTSDKYETLID